MLIQVDVDSTLYDADKLFGKIAEGMGVKWKYKATHWMTSDDLDLDLKTMKQIFRTSHSYEVVQNNKPYPGAVEALQGIVNDYDDIEIAYVSDRNEQQTGALRDWLDVQGFLHSEDAHVQATKDKRHWMRERRPEIVIDDRVRTMLMARFELDAYVASLVQPHNINLTDEVEHIYIVENWKAIDTVLREIVIPKIQEKGVSRTRQRNYTKV